MTQKQNIGFGDSFYLKNEHVHDKRKESIFSVQNSGHLLYGNKSGTLSIGLHQSTSNNSIAYFLSFLWPKVMCIIQGLLTLYWNAAASET